MGKNQCQDIVEECDVGMQSIYVQAESYLHVELGRIINYYLTYLEREKNKR